MVLASPIYIPSQMRNSDKMQTKQVVGQSIVNCTLGVICLRCKRGFIVHGVLRLVKEPSHMPLGQNASNVFPAYKWDASR
jgi:hypothetical protein